MNRLLLLGLVLPLAGCMGLGRSYGDPFPAGKTLRTQCVSVQSFAESLRSAPIDRAPGAFLAYEDFGPGMSRGLVYLINPLSGEVPESAAELLRATDPKRREFWLQASLTAGSLAIGQTFEAFVPADQRVISPRSIITDREAILIRGQLVAACDRVFLVSVQGNPFSLAVQESDWQKLRERFGLFERALAWP